jgi:hypothetical protein
MNEEVRTLLAQMPERASRSKLEPHVEVIQELRRKRHTYREIALFLREHFQIAVTHTTVFDFVKMRARRPGDEAETRPEFNAQEATLQSEFQSTPEPPTSARFPSNDAVLERIRAVRDEPIPEPPKRLFVYNPDEPLELQTKTKEKSNGNSHTTTGESAGKRARDFHAGR